MINIDSNTINIKSTIRDALARLTVLGENLTLFVVDKNMILLGVITDGDIRRGLLKGLKISDSVSSVMNKDFESLKEDNISIQEIKRIKSKNFLRIIPILSNNNRIIKFINISEIKDFLPLDAVIMAGGKGERLMPLTAYTPKPMLMVSEKPILEHNIDLLSKYGISKIFLSVNYLKEKIINHFSDGSTKGIVIKYLIEDKALGTIGSIKLAKNYNYDDILVMNSDLLTNIDLSDFFNSYKKMNADMAIATTSYNIDVPYAILESKDGFVKSLKEKPKYTFFSNAGIYLISRKLLNIIPDDKFYNATDLINELIRLNKVVINYPILGYWLDIGRHEDFKKAQEDYKHIIF